MAAPACHAGDAVARAASRAAGITKVDLRLTLSGLEAVACKIKKSTEVWSTQQSKFLPCKHMQ